MEFRRAIALTFAAAFMALPSFAAPGFRLEQRSDFYGESVAEVSRRSMRLQSSKLQLKLHVTAPEFELTAVNDRNQQFAKLPFDRWRGFIVDRKERAPRAMVKRRDVTICGLKAEEWWVDSSKREQLTKAGLEKLSYKGKSYNTHYWVTKDIAPPPEAYQVFSTALGMPSYLGLPLRMVQFNGDGKPFVTFDTLKVEKCTINDKLAVPQKYTRAADEMSWLVSGLVDKTALAGIMDDDDDSVASMLTAAKRKKRKELRGWVPGMEIVDDGSKPVTSRQQAALAGSWTPGQ